MGGPGPVDFATPDHNPTPPGPQKGGERGSEGEKQQLLEPREDEQVPALTNWRFELEERTPIVQAGWHVSWSWI